MEKGFFKRIRKFEIGNIILSYDTIIAIVVFFLIGIYKNWQIDSIIASDMLSVIINVSAILFSIVLAGFAIISSMTDKDFLVAWVKAEGYENIITIFEYNLYIPSILLILALFLKYILYNDLIMIFTIALFTYMIFSLIDLVKFIARFALQRADFVTINE